MNSSAQRINPDNADGPAPEIVAQWILGKQLQITSFVRSIVGDIHTSEDIFQEVCIAAIKAHQRFDSPEGSIRWAMKVARNKAFDHLRRRPNQVQTFSPELLDLLSDDWTSANRTQVGDEVSGSNYEQLERCLDKLTSRSRKLLSMRYGGDKKPAEIAIVTGQKLQSVYKQITRAHTALRSCLKNLNQGGQTNNMETP